MRLIHRQRRQHRQHLRGEVAGQFGPLRGGEVGGTAEPHPVPFQPRQDFVVQTGVLPFHQPFDFAAGGGQLVSGTVARRIRQILLHFDQLAQPGDPNHEKFVEVAAEDRDDFQPLQQRIRRAERFVQHPRVEIQPAQLPADEQFTVGSFVLFVLFRTHNDNGASSIFTSNPNTCVNNPPFISR